MRSRKSQSGFTLTELLVVIALMFIIAMLGMPALQNLVARTQLESKARELSIFVQQMRMTAVKNNRNVIVEFSLGAQDLLMAFQDDDGDGTQDADERNVGRFDLVGRTRLAGPGGAEDPDGVNDFENPAAPGIPRLILRGDGTVSFPGAMVVSDPRGNYLRVRVNRFAKTDLSKWDTAGSAWLSQDQGKDWEWY